MKPKKNSGQMLMEVLFALSITTLVLVALVAGAVTSLRNVQHARNMVLGNQLAQQGLELIRKARDAAAGWDNFMISYKTGVIFWCVDANGQLISEPNGCTSCSLINNLFKRCLTFTWKTNFVTVLMTVSWDEAGVTRQVRATTVFTKWAK